MDLKIILPDREIVVIRTKKNATADSVYNSVIDKIQMSENTSVYFYLFEIVEYNFGEYKNFLTHDSIFFFITLKHMKFIFYTLITYKTIKLYFIRKENSTK